MFEKINNPGSDRSTFSYIFQSKWRYLCSNHLSKKCIWRWISIISFIAYKSKLAPMNAYSHPGAMLELHLCKMVSKVLGGHIMKKFVFWCDSINVFYWIKNPSRKFKSFVVNRTGETEPTQWNFVNGRINPVDIGSRGMDLSLSGCSTW